jgi:hypothetical protein
MSEIVIIAIFLKRSGKAKYRISNVTWSLSLTIKAQPKKISQTQRSDIRFIVQPIGSTDDIQVDTCSMGMSQAIFEE